jgi:SRSO17 transposase
MLQFETLPSSLAGLLWAFRWCFTGPSFATFAALVAGLVAQPGRRTVTGMLQAAGLAGVWHHARAYWFLGRARWDLDAVGTVLARLVVARLVPAGAAVLVVVDDTLFRRSGRRVAGTAWQHDASRAGPRASQVSWGTCFVVAGIVVDLPFCDRPVCLPVLARLWIPGGPVSKQVLLSQLVAAIAAAVPGRSLHVVADAAYAGADGAETRKALAGRGLPGGVSLTSRLRVNAALHAIAAPVAGRSRRGGRPRRIGARLGTPTDLARTATQQQAWRPAVVTRYGRSDRVDITETVCLWYGTYRSRAVRVILVREPGSTAKAGYDLALISTDLDSSTETVVARYAARWAIEVAIEDAKQTTGVGQAHTRTRQAVERTVPFGLTVQSIVIVWYAGHGHSPDIAAQRRAAAPWYRTKTRPAYLDMIIKLRRILITARFRAGQARTPTPEETLQVQLAWAEAAA